MEHDMARSGTLAGRRWRRIHRDQLARYIIEPEREYAVETLVRDGDKRPLGSNST
jgi:hypothetical protein